MAPREHGVERRHADDDALQYGTLSHAAGALAVLIDYSTLRSKGLEIGFKLGFARAETVRTASGGLTLINHRHPKE